MERYAERGGSDKLRAAQPPPPADWPKFALRTRGGCSGSAMEAALSPDVLVDAALRRDRAKPRWSVTGRTVRWGRGLGRPFALTRVAWSRGAATDAAQSTEGGEIPRVTPAARLGLAGPWPRVGFAGRRGVRAAPARPVLGVREPFCILGNSGALLRVFFFSPP